MAVVGASTSLFGAIWAQAELRKVLTAIGARVIDLELPVARAQDAFDSSGALGDPQQRAVLAEIVGTLVAEARLPAHQAA